MSPDHQKTGLFLVGVRGSIATTVLHGLEALHTGVPPLGMVTEAPAFAGHPFVPLSRLRVRGWDVAGDLHRSAEELSRIGVLPRDLVELCADLRDRVELSTCSGIAEPEDSQLIDPRARERLMLPPPAAVEALRADIRSWLQEDGFRRAVVVYLATPERSRETPEEWSNPEAEPLKLLDEAPQDISRSILYATAAIAEGLPFINFTSAPGAAVPALAGFAARKRVPVLGNDGKTGETLVKSVLAPLFRDRHLKVMSWEGTNMLGNRDGAALEDAARRQSKLANKDHVVPSILSDPAAHVQSHIHFVPSLHDWKTAWDFIHFEGWLGTRMSLQFTWQGSDSALAAPLVLDLARLALLALERGVAGPLVAAAPFFKNPLGTEEHDFHRQMDGLRLWLEEGKKG